MIIPEVSTFLLSNSNVYITTDNIINQLHDKDIIYFHEGSMYNIKEINNFILFEYFSKIDGFERTVAINWNNKIFDNSKVVDNLMLRGNIINGKSLALKYDNEYNINIGLLTTEIGFSIRFLKVDFHVNKFLLNHSSVLLSDEDTILYYSISNLTEFKWKKENLGKIDSKNKKTQIEKLIGIYNNELWVHLSNNSLLILSIFDGEEILHINNLQSNAVIGDVFLDEINKKIKILAYKYYMEIDLQDKKIEIKKEFEHGWSIGNGRFYEGDKYIYFCGTENGYTKKSIGKNTTGIFNTETCEIEWYYTLEDDEKLNFFVDVPQANDTYFGVRGSENKLYLFERNSILTKK